MARTGERENLMKMIYQMGVQEDFSAEEYEKFTALQADSQITEYFVNGYRAAASNLKEIDELIDRYSVRWKTSRLPKVDLAILRLALAEICYLTDIPVSVTINEAVELAKNTVQKSRRSLSTACWEAPRGMPAYRLIRARRLQAAKMRDEKGAMSSGGVLAFDTSNYTTSAAIADLSGEILADCRSLLKVREKERGLRQSHALFQHENLPGLVRRAVSESGIRRENICAVAVSERPRPVEGSYMPVFRAGVSVAESIAAALRVPVYRYSHQEGHIAAVCGALDESVRTVSFHLSGGTGEILATQGCRPVCVIGGIRDLSFGQLIDRAGVALGLRISRRRCAGPHCLPDGGSRFFKIFLQGNTKIGHPVTGPIHVEGAYANLSGIETQILREIGNLKKRKDRETVSGKIRSLDEDTLLSGKDGEEARRESELSAEERRLAAELFCRMADALLRLSVSALQSAETDTIIFAGGVSASQFLRRELDARFKNRDFGQSSAIRK